MRPATAEAFIVLACAMVVGPWYTTNVLVFQPDVHGVRLSPIVDFTFLQHVYRQAPAR